MRRRDVVWRGLATLAVTVMVTGEPARADWQYTQWGMSPAEVQAAADGSAVANADRRLDAADLAAKLTAFYRGDKRPFTAVFLFEQDKLAAVTLNPTDRISCPDILQSLLTHYGKPLSVDEHLYAQTRSWNDIEADNVVVFLDLGAGNCSIQYSRLPPTRQDGGL